MSLILFKLCALYLISGNLDINMCVNKCVNKWQSCKIDSNVVASRKAYEGKIGKREDRGKEKQEHRFLLKQTSSLTLWTQTSIPSAWLGMRLICRTATSKLSNVTEKRVRVPGGVMSIDCNQSERMKEM